jgi:RNA polymerase sigma-70 factor (ECF subfamily)
MADMNEPRDPAAVGELRRQPDTIVVPALQRLHPGASVTDRIAAAYDSYQRELHSFALLGTHDPAAAEDVVQEAFLRLVREVGAGRSPENVRAWLYTVAANLIASRGRRTAVADRWRSFFVVRDTAAAPESEYLRREMSDEVHEAMAALTREARVSLLLAAHGFSGREIAAAIGRSETATRSLMWRARLTMRDQLEAMGITA